MEMVGRARPVYEHLLETLGSGVGEKNSQERELLLQRIFPYINIINSEVRREAALEQLSATVGASVRAVMSDFERWQKGEQPQRFERKPTASPTYSIGRDVALMLATAQDGGLFAYLRSRVSPDDLTDKTARQLYLFLEDAFRHEDEVPRGLIDRISDENLRNAVLEKLTSGEYAGWTRADVERAVDRIRIRALEDQQRHVEVELKRLGNDDGRHLRELLERKMAIDQELGNLKVRADD
jgi:DNA primase